MGLHKEKINQVYCKFSRGDNSPKINLVNKKGVPREHKRM